MRRQSSETERHLHSAGELVEQTCTRERLDELEAMIERGLEAYIQTGQALAEIRDTRAYLLAGHSSFNAYLEDRWAWSRRTAFNLLTAAAVAQDLALVQPLAPPPTQMQAVHLAKLDPADRRTLVTSLERPLVDYTTRELQQRVKVFQQEITARRQAFVQQERPPRRRLVSDDIQIEALDPARTAFADGIFDLVVGSPPFALDVPYADGGDVPDYSPTYRRHMTDWSAELYRVSNPEHGRVCIEIPVDRSKGGVYEPVYAHWQHALEGAGFRYRTTILRRYHAGRGTARGSVDSPSGTHTFVPLLAIIVAYRGTWIRRSDRAHDLEHDDWLALAGPNGYWDDIPGDEDPEHPAPFHIEVPRRLLKLYSYRDDLVGDLWLGRGTSALACVELGRRFRGGDRSPTYVGIAQERVAAALDRQLGG